MAQTQLYTKKAQVFVVEEATQDTYQTQGATDAIFAEIPDAPITINSSNYEPTTVRGDFLLQDEIPGAASATVNFRVPLHGSGTAGTAPEFGEALKACGFEETTVATTSVTYTPLSTFDGSGGNPGPSYSVTVIVDGLAFRVKGAFGNVVFEGTVGEPMFANFTFTGAFSAATDDALETTSYDTAISPSFKGASFVENFDDGTDGYTPKGINSFNLDMGNNVVAVSDINDTYGYYGSRIVGRKTIGSFDPELVLVATQDFFGNWASGQTGTITTGAIGATAGNIYTLSIARAVKRPPEPGSRDGIAVLTVPFAVSSAATDVEGTNADVSLAFT